MELEYDAAKNEQNIRERHLSFERARDFDFKTADLKLVQRGGELRVVAVGYLDGLLHLICFVPRTNGLRVISFRRAARKERREYADKRQ